MKVEMWKKEMDKGKNKVAMDPIKMEEEDNGKRWKGT
jgi:hypothetical protein